MIELTKITYVDLEALFEFQTNKDDIWMAAFMPENSADKIYFSETEGTLPKNLLFLFLYKLFPILNILHLIRIGE